VRCHDAAGYRTHSITIGEYDLRHRPWVRPHPWTGQLESAGP